MNESGEESTGEYEEQLTKLEIQVVDISRNMSILMAALESKFGPFGYYGGSNSEVGSEDKSRYKGRKGAKERAREIATKF